MTQEQKRIRIAEACGWKQCPTAMLHGFSPAGAWRQSSKHGVTSLPDYFNDLNACHEAEKTLTQFERSIYRDLLPSSFPGEPSAYWHATAAQRAEAFGRAKGLWE